MRLLSAKEESEHEALLVVLKRACERAGSALHTDGAPLTPAEEAVWLATEGSIAALVHRIREIQAQVSQEEIKQPSVQTHGPMTQVSMGVGPTRLQWPSSRPAPPEQPVMPWLARSATSRPNSNSEGSTTKPFCCPPTG